MIHLVGYKDNLVNIVCVKEGDEERVIDTVHFGADGGQRGYNLSLKHAIETFQKQNQLGDLAQAFITMASLSSLITVAAEYFPWDVEFVFVTGPNFNIPWRLAALDFGLCEFIPDVIVETKMMYKNQQQELKVKRIKPLDEPLFIAQTIHDWIINHDWYRPALSNMRYFLIFSSAYLKFSIGIVGNKKTQKSPRALLWENVVNKLYQLFMVTMHNHFAKRVVKSVLNSYRNIKSISFKVRVTIHKRLMDIIRQKPDLSVKIFQKFIGFSFSKIDATLKTQINLRTQIVYSVARDILASRSQLKKKSHFALFNQMIPDYIDDMINIVETEVRRLERLLSRDQNCIRFVEQQIAQYLRVEIIRKSQENKKKSLLPAWWPDIIRFMSKIEADPTKRKRYDEDEDEKPKRKKRKKKKREIDTDEEFEEFFGEDTSSSSSEEEEIIETTTSRGKKTRVRRKKKKRKKKKPEEEGIPCEECEKFFKSATKGMTRKQKREIMRACKHCKKEEKPPTTPTGFWDIKFFTSEEEDDDDDNPKIGTNTNNGETEEEEQERLRRIARMRQYPEEEIDLTKYPYPGPPSSVTPSIPESSEYMPDEWYREQRKRELEELSREIDTIDISKKPKITFDELSRRWLE
jgi:hypothetical protein